MFIEQRKIELINWITDLKNESLINRMEELKKVSFRNTPKEIISLLDTSNATNPSELVEHTTARDLLAN
jgi:hypothetical protein